MKRWNAAAYLRTSKSKEDDPSNTIHTQLAIIMDFISNNNDIELCSVKVDNGYTGLNFNRPAYQEMMGEIDSGKIDCIIVKDLSRFTRNHLDAGEMLFHKFAIMKVRFIAVLDDVDMLYWNEWQQDFFIPFRTLMNQAYSMDISQKISSQLKIKRERGEFVGGNSVYGYKRSPSNRHQLVVDEPAAAVVRDIFRWRLEGLSADRIAQRLNEMGVPSPAEYKRRSGSSYICHFQQKESPIWFAGPVIRILRNRVYIGTLEQGKSKTNLLYPKLSKHLPESEWAIKEHAHEAIISEESFEAVGRLLKTDARTPPNQEVPYLFSGIVRCAACKSTLTRKTVGKYKYYCCSLAKSIKGSCIGCQIPVENLDAHVQQIICEHINDVISLRRRIAAGNFEDKLKKQIQRLKDDIQAVDIDIEKKQRLIRRLEPDMAEGLLTKEEVYQFREEFGAERNDLEKKRNRILDQIREIEDGTLLECGWAEQYVPYAGQTSFSRKDVAMLVEAIFLHKDKHIEVCFVHDQEFQYIRKILE